MSDKYIIIDKIKWWVSVKTEGLERTLQPLCPIHHLRIRPVEDNYSSNLNFQLESHSLRCEDCNKSYEIPRGYGKEYEYVLDRIDAKIFSAAKYINLDDEALPIAEDKIPKNSEYFVTSLLTQSKLGLRLVVYAGKRGSSKKTQIFVEPDAKRLAFDQRDLHPTDVFTKLEATFSDGSKSSQKKYKQSNNYERK